MPAGKRCHSSIDMHHVCCCSIDMSVVHLWPVRHGSVSCEWLTFSRSRGTFAKPSGAMTFVLKSLSLPEARRHLKMNLSMLEMLKGNTDPEDLAVLRRLWIDPFEELITELNERHRRGLGDGG